MATFLERVGPAGAWAMSTDAEARRALLSNPLAENRSQWRLGAEIPEPVEHFVPTVPSKIVGIGRSYREHASELGNPVPAEPLVFLKATSSLLANDGVVVLPFDCGRVDFEGEFALVVGERLTAVGAREARAGLLGVTLACDVTARELQKRDRTFARAKSFDTFCPLGPRLRIDPDWDELELSTRVNGVERQRGRVGDLLWSFGELVSYVSRHMSLEPGDVVLTGTPAGVGPLTPGDGVEVDCSQVGCLAFTVSASEATAADSLGSGG